MAQKNWQYRFGPYEVSVRSREVHKHGTKIRLRPQAFQVLLLLLERAGDVVTREELRNGVWSADTFVDFEHGLNTAIKELRGQLSDSATEPRYIETLPKLGYRLIYPVETEQETPAVPVDEPPVALESQPPVEVPELSATTSKSFLWKWAAAAVAIAIGAAVWITIAKWQRKSPTQTATGPKSPVLLAVLPFDNLTGDESQEYFSDGLTEELIAQIGRLGSQEFGVIARTSVMHYKHSGAKTDQIGRELGVRYLVEGSVRRDSNQVRINAELIDTESQTPVWTKEYDRDVTSLLAVQEEIADEITDSIQLTLGKPAVASVPRKPPMTPEEYQAYDLYLKGLYFWNKRSGPGFEQAIRYFQQAIDKDPNYAQAYAGLANSYTLMSGYTVSPASKYMPKAREAALRALQLDDGLAEAHAALALVIENYDWDWDGSEKEYRRAIQLNPDYATAHQWYAEQLGWRGRFEEAFRESERARQIDPFSLIIATDKAELYYYSRQYDRAIETFDAVREMDPNFQRANSILDVYVQTGRYKEALAGYELWRAQYDDPTLWSKMVYYYCQSGQPEKAGEELKKLEAGIQKHPEDPSIMVVPNYCTGNKARAYYWLEATFSEHSNAMTMLKVEPAYDPMRNDPQFQDVLRRVGLAQ